MDSCPTFRNGGQQFQERCWKVTVEYVIVVFRGNSSESSDGKIRNGIQFEICQARRDRRMLLVMKCKILRQIFF